MLRRRRVDDQEVVVAAASRARAGAPSPCTPASRRARSRCSRRCGSSSTRSAAASRRRVALDQLVEGALGVEHHRVERADRRAPCMRRPSGTRCGSPSSVGDAERVAQAARRIDGQHGGAAAAASRRRSRARRPSWSCRRRRCRRRRADAGASSSERERPARSARRSRPASDRGAADRCGSVIARSSRDPSRVADARAREARRRAARASGELPRRRRAASTRADPGSACVSRRIWRSAARWRARLKRATGRYGCPCSAGRRTARRAARAALGAREAERVDGVHDRPAAA